MPLTRTAFSRLACLAAFAAAAAACGPPPDAGHAKRARRPPPPPPSEARARTIVDLSVADPLAGFVTAEVPEQVAKALRRPESAESRVAEWIDALRSAEVLTLATTEAGSTLAADDVRVERSGTRFEISVVGTNGDAATARCLALVRAAKKWESMRRTSAIEAWIRAERARSLAELHKLEESLRAAPADDTDDAGKTPDEERARILARRQALAQAPPVGTDMLATLLRSIERAKRRALELRTLGLGDQHPDARGEDAYLRALEAFVPKQRDADLDADQAALAQLDAKETVVVARLAPAARVRRARLVARAKGLEQPFAEGVAPSLVPLGVRLLVAEQREAIAARAAAAEALGPSHPRRALVDAEVAIVTRKVDLERQAALASAKAELAELEAPRPPNTRGDAKADTKTAPTPQADPRLDQARAVRARLVALVAQLEAVEGRLGVPEVDAKIVLPCGAH